MCNLRNTSTTELATCLLVRNTITVGTLTGPLNLSMRLLGLQSISGSIDADKDDEQDVE